MSSSTAPASRIRPGTVVLACVLLASMPHEARAQSLEESYAKLCADSAAAREETCVALRRSLMAKLAAHDSVRAGRGASAAPGDGVTDGAGTTPPPVALPAELQQRWDLLAKLAGRTFHARVPVPGGSDTDMLYTYSWVEPGGELAIYSTSYGRGGMVVNDTTQRYAWNDSTRHIELRLNGKAFARFQPRAEGGLSIVPLQSVPEWSQRYRNYWRMLPDGSFENVSEENRKGAWVRTFRILSREWTPALREGVDRQQEQARVAAHQAEARAAADRARRSRVLRTFVGAAIGAGVAAGHGGDATQVVGGAMKGVEIVNPGSPAAQALGAQGSALVTGSGAGAAAGGAGTAGGTAAGDPVKPNLAASACPGFTDENYRTRALQKDGDTQLWTMCGQAFEYYTMYLRARRQGYAKADYERTYSAHAQSAQVAQGYARSHAASP